MIITRSGCPGKRKGLASLARVAGFIGIGAPGEWLDLAGRTVDPTRTGTAAAELEAGALARLRAACEPGTRALAGASAQPTAPPAR